jgi:hypothetical protein
MNQARQIAEDRFAISLVYCLQRLYLIAVIARLDRAIQ